MTYAQIAQEIAALVEEKERAYGSSFSKAGQVMRILYPNGIPPEKLDDALTLIRVIDKIFRIATDRDALGESPYRDIVGYGLLAVKRQERRTFDPDKTVQYPLEVSSALRQLEPGDFVEVEDEDNAVYPLTDVVGK